MLSALTRRSTSGAVALALAALIVLPGSGLAASSFKTGVYHGTTSQGNPFVLRVANIACPNKRRLCIYMPDTSTATEANIIEPCSGGGSTNAPVELNPTPVPHSGVVHSTSTAFSTVTVHLTIKHSGTISGTFEATGLAGGSSADCASGVVTFTAKRS